MSFPDEKPEALGRLEDPQLDRLGEFLEKHYDQGAMDLEELDGFFAALHCCPELVMPSEYLPVVLGDFVEEGFASEKEAQTILDLIVRHWNALGEALRTDDVFVPLLLEDANGKARGNSWASGFMSGVDMRKEVWRDILDEKQKFDWLTPILILDYEDDPDPKLQPLKEPLTDEEREHVFAMMSLAVMEIFRYFAPHRVENARAGAAVVPGHGKRRVSKIGRNDPCYCGSGKKYKKCCGALPVN